MSLTLRFACLALLPALAQPALATPCAPSAPLVSSARTRVPSAFRVRFLQLASDPSHGNEATPGSRREAYVGLRLEKRGLLPAPIHRDPSGAAEFIDAQGVKWDVKGFHSHWPPQEGGFDVLEAETRLAEEIASGQKIILDMKNLSTQHGLMLDGLVGSRGWSPYIVWYPARPKAP